MAAQRGGGGRKRPASGGRKAPGKKAPGKKAPVRKPAGKKTSGKKTSAKKTAAKKTSTKKSGGASRSGTTRRVAKQKAFKVTPMPVVIESDGKVRLNRFLASAGICSRRAADDLIKSGRVSINGKVVQELGVRIDPLADTVAHDGETVVQEKKVYVLFNKPKGVVCTNARNEQRQRVIDFLDRVKGRIYTIGRLDVDSEGLILLTNDGEFAQEMAHPSFGVPKTYAVLVRGSVDTQAVKKVRGGVWLAEGRTSGARIKIERRGRDKTYLKVTLREGKNREIRRVFAKLGNPVLSLKRVRIGSLTLHSLRSGKHRLLRANEIDELRRIARAPDPVVEEEPATTTRRQK